MGLEGGGEGPDAWFFWFPQVSRDLWVPEAKGLCHLVLLEAKVTTGWKHGSQKLLYCGSIWAAITSFEDLEPEMRDVVWPHLTLHRPLSPGSHFSSYVLPAAQGLLHLILLLLFFLSLILIFYQSPVPCLWDVRWGWGGGLSLFFLFPLPSFPATPTLAPMTHTQLHSLWSCSPRWTWFLGRPSRSLAGQSWSPPALAVPSASIDMRMKRISGEDALLYPGHTEQGHSVSKYWGVLL